MPYCPKCDMEFIDEITVCTDCGGTLPESGEPAAQKADSRVYVSKRQRYEDMSSSLSAFLLVGGIFLAFGILCWVNIINLPMDAATFTLFRIVLTAMGVGSLIIAMVTKKSSNAMKIAADLEDAQTKELIDWFLSAYSATALDAELLKEDPSLEGNELTLKRFDIIQDRLITSHDLPDQNYVDFLGEELYGRLFETS